MFSFGKVKDDIGPALTKMAAAAKNPLPIFRAMGTTFKSLTEGTFNSVGAAYRPAPWPAKKDGTPSILQKSGTLVHSFHLEVSNKHAEVSTPVVYARIHQFGSEGHFIGKGGIPPRPFFPVGPDGKLTPMAYNVVANAGHRALAREIGAKE